MIFFSPFPVLERIALVGGSASVRTPQIRTCAGGIGVRAARAARASGKVPVTVAGFQGGRMGILLGERFDAEGMEYHLVKTTTQTRGSILTIDKERGSVSEILDAPQIATADEWANLFDSVAELVAESRLLVVCGRDEFGTEAGFVPFLEAAATCGLPIVGDVTGAAWDVLVARPTLFLRMDLPVLQRATETSLQHDSAIVAMSARLSARARACGMCAYRWGTMGFCWSAATRRGVCARPSFRVTNPSEWPKPSPGHSRRAF